jgi:formylglycine-generating enzyme required for sulfatase activity
MKNVLMYDKHSIGKPIIELNERSWDYEYYNSQSVIQNSRYRDSNLNPIRLIPFDYEGVKFNMITCPAGGKVNIDNWGLQEIKEPIMLGETEVTQELFEAVMGFNYSNYKDSNKKPMDNITWYDCIGFCNILSDYFNLSHCYMLNNKKFTSNNYPLSIEKAEITFIGWADGFRLPKEWEWQIASMAGTNNQYAGANDDESLESVAWFSGNTNNVLRPVAQKMPNEWGFYDMSGSLWEWCENSNEPNENKESSAHRVFRGGSWGNGASALRSAYRSANSPGDRGDFVGFRVARSI